MNNELLMPTQSHYLCACPGADKHRLGGVFRYGDAVLVHYADGTTESGTVLSTLADRAEVMLGDHQFLTIATDKLWLAGP